VLIPDNSKAIVQIADPLAPAAHRRLPRICAGARASSSCCRGRGFLGICAGARASSSCCRGRGFLEYAQARSFVVLLPWTWMRHVYALLGLCRRFATPASRRSAPSRSPTGLVVGH